MTIYKMQLKQSNPVTHITDFQLICGTFRDYKNTDTIPWDTLSGMTREKSYKKINLLHFRQNQAWEDPEKQSHYAAFFQKAPLGFYEMSFKFH